jgi:hypothetical protein
VTRANHSPLTFCKKANVRFGTVEYRLAENSFWVSNPAPRAFAADGPAPRNEGF